MSKEIKIESVIRKVEITTRLDELTQLPDKKRSLLPGEDFSRDEDCLYDEAVQIVLETRKASISYVQRRRNNS